MPDRESSTHQSCNENKLLIWLILIICQLIKCHRTELYQPNLFLHVHLFSVTLKIVYCTCFNSQHQREHPCEISECIWITLVLCKWRLTSETFLWIARDLPALLLRSAGRSRSTYLGTPAPGCIFIYLYPASSVFSAVSCCHVIFALFMSYVGTLCGPMLFYVVLFWNCVAP